MRKGLTTRFLFREYPACRYIFDSGNEVGSNAETGKNERLL
jgi:hypothetical protein